MSKLAKLQEEKLEKLKKLSSAGRVQLEEALASENPASSPGPAEIISVAESEAPAASETSAALVQKVGRRPVGRGKRLGRPPFGHRNEGIHGLSSRIGLCRAGRFSLQERQKRVQTSGIE